MARMMGRDSDAQGVRLHEMQCSDLHGGTNRCVKTQCVGSPRLLSLRENAEVLQVSVLSERPR